MPNGVITLNDGTKYENSNCGYADGFLWCFIVGYSMQDVAIKFFDVAAIGIITYEYGSMKKIYEGFTEVYVIQLQENGCNVCLKRPSASEVQA